MRALYLLFDPGCGVCTSLASEIERIAGGRLAARSLADPEMTQQLERARPNTRWEPTLLEIRDESVTAHTGRMLGWRLISVLGLRRAWTISRLLGITTPRGSGRGTTRRAFLTSGIRWAGGAIGVLILGQIAAQPAFASSQPSCQEQCRQFYVNCASNCAARYKACVARGGTNCQEEHSRCVADCQAIRNLCLKNC